MSTRVVWAGSAQKDLKDIIAWYLGQTDQETASNLVNRIFTATDRLLAFPNYGRPGDAPGTRELSVLNLPYVIVYRANGQVEILRVLHMSRNRQGLAHADKPCFKG